MKKALILYWHGLGDIIQLTPVLRHLYKEGYIIDLMCRKEVRTSHLLDDCPYIKKLIEVINPWRSDKSFEKQSTENIELFNSLKKSYDWSGKCLHKNIQICKVLNNYKECNLSIIDNDLEVFIPKYIEDEALNYITNNYPNGYIHNHTMIEFHKNHNWNSINWINSNLPQLPIIDTGYDGNHYMINDNINFSFVLAREATYRIFSSSVLVHACDAMKCNIDVVNYGKPSRYALPLKKIINKVRENKKWINTNEL